MRKEIDITITDGTPETNRDHGKVFHIREMPASKAEKWATRALLAVMHAGLEIPENIGGMQGIAIAGLQVLGKINFFEAEPLLDEMMECITIKPDPRNPGIVRALIEDDIEEIGTRIKLRQEVLELHTGFFSAGARSISTSEPPAQPSSTTPTSPRRSAPQSHPAKRP